MGTQMGCKSIPAAAKLEDRHGPHDWQVQSAGQVGIPIPLKHNHKDLI